MKPALSISEVWEPAAAMAVARAMATTLAAQGALTMAMAVTMVSAKV